MWLSRGRPDESMQIVHLVGGPDRPRVDGFRQGLKSTNLRVVFLKTILNDGSCFFQLAGDAEAEVELDVGVGELKPEFSGGISRRYRRLRNRE